MARGVAPADVDVTIYEGLEALPHFNPDRDDEHPPASVTEFRGLVAAADGILIATPEYAHGAPGALKDAFDWLVGTGELYGKAVVIVNAAAIEDRGVNGRGELERTLRAQGARILTSAPVLVPPRADPRDVPSVRADMAAHLRLFRSGGA